MSDSEKYDALMDSCFGGITGIVQTPLYKKSVELYFLFLNSENTFADWKDQACRAATSVGANLCEGYGRGTPGQKTQFYKYARGSAYECVHWANLGEKQRESLLNKALELASLMDSELMSVAREAQEIS
jgi:four helix bundle protein